MNRLLRCLMIAVFSLPGVVLFTGCESTGRLAEIGAQAAAGAGAISTNEAASIARAGKAVGKAFQQITPRQEYYIGRSVAATVLDAYDPWDNAEATRYINVLGQTLARASDMPETYGGYHFMILDSDQINAFGCPGGLIFITRGMLRLCRNEAEVAAVLAHEVGHVENKHGLRAIKKSRLTSALTIIAAESARQLGDGDVRRLTTALEGSVSDITQTLVNSGYARRLEHEADASCIAILQRVGYDTRALVRMLEEMDRQLKPGAPDFARTHPDPDVRIRQILRSINGQRVNPANPERRQRFREALSGV